MKWKNKPNNNILLETSSVNQCLLISSNKNIWGQNQGQTSPSIFMSNDISFQQSSSIAFYKSNKLLCINPRNKNIWGQNQGHTSPSKFMSNDIVKSA